MYRGALWEKYFNKNTIIKTFTLKLIAWELPTHRRWATKDVRRLNIEFISLRRSIWKNLVIIFSFSWLRLGIEEQDGTFKSVENTNSQRSVWWYLSGKKEKLFNFNCLYLIKYTEYSKSTKTSHSNIRKHSGVIKKSEPNNDSGNTPVTWTNKPDTS